MANKHPDTSGLISLADRPNNERTTIQSQGGIASGKKRKELKKMYEIIQGFRLKTEKDPVEKAIKSLLNNLTNPLTPINDIVKGLKFINEMERSDNSGTPMVIYKYITPEELKELDEHIDCVIGNTKTLD